MAWTVKTEGEHQLRELQARLRQAGDGGGMRRKFRRQVQEAGRPVVADIRAAAMAVNVTTLGTVSRRRHSPARPKGLRARVARSTGIAVTRKGIRIRVSAQRFGAYGVTLPRYLDADLPRWKTWRHPVFGDRDRWATQRGQPYFFVTIRRHYAGFDRAVRTVMDDIARELTR